MYLGALLVLVMIFRPQGMFPSKRRLREFQDSEQGLGSADAMSNLNAMGSRMEGPYSEGRGWQEPEAGMGNAGGRLE